MSNIAAHVRLLQRTLILLAILLGTNAWAQAPSNVGSAQQDDPFKQLHSALSAAADNFLAAQRSAEAVLPASSSIQRPDAADAENGVMRAGSRARAWQRVEQLRPLIEPILREEGVPTELAAVVLIESGGQPTALSPKGARGIWQFMPDTARRYGLAVRPGTDERLDLRKSTRAAARYLADLHERFGDWPLALAAYNAGEELVRAAVAKAGRADFASISSLLPSETRNYVPAVLGVVGQMPSVQPAQLLARGTRQVLYAAANVD